MLLEAKQVRHARANHTNGANSAITVNFSLVHFSHESTPQRLVHLQVNKIISTLLYLFVTFASNLC